MKIFALASLLLSMPLQLLAGNYNYSYYGEALHSAPGMTFATFFDAQTLGIELGSPEDLVIFDNQIYIIDSDINALVMVDENFSLIDALYTFVPNQVYLDYLSEKGLPSISELTLSNPSGIDVTDNAIYICDTGNFRIVKLNKEFQVIAVFDDMDDQTFTKEDNPETEVDESLDVINFEPLKITVDKTGRMYVVAKNIFEGIMEVNYDGAFNRFTGVNPLKLTPVEIFRRSLMTEAQLDQLQLYLPTEYTNVKINDDSFIYATSRVSTNNDENPIQLINPKGVDVIKRNGYHPPMADVHYVIGKNNHVIDGPSDLVAIADTKDGIYTVLDQKRSRLFTYDSEGNLLYVNGDEGSQSDKFSEGVALDYLNNDLLVLDRGTKTVVVYQLTDFGQKVNLAIHHHNEGEFDEAALVWEEVIKINTNYEIAYNGIGKLLLRQGKFKEAMEYFELGHDQYYYSKAFKSYRNEILEENFTYITIGALLIVGTLIGLKVRSTLKKGESMLYED